MRKLILLLLVVNAFATTTVSGNLKTLGTGNVSGAFVRFWLRGCQGNQPRINGTGIIAPSQGGVFFIDLPASATGVISGTIYSTRDITGNLGGEIECGGSTTAVWYGMQTFYAGKGGPEVPVQARSGATLDITSITPITTNPVVTSPTGDTTYLRKDAGNNPATGSFQFTGNNSLTGQNSLTAYKVNNVLIVDGQKYATPLAAYADLPSGGGVIYMPAGSYSLALGSLTVSKSVRFLCENPKTTAISFTGAGVGFLVNYDGAPPVGSLSDWGGAGIENCTLSGPSAGTAIQLGDVGHSSIGFNLKNNVIRGFAIGLTWGNGNSWGFRSEHNVFTANTQDIVYNLSTGIGCANCLFEHTIFQGSQQANAIQFAGTTGGMFSFIDSFFTDEPITVGGTSGFQLDFGNCDFENTVNGTTAFLAQTNGTIYMHGLNLFQQTKASGSFPASFITVSAGNLTAKGIWAVSSQTMTSLIAISGSANVDMQTSNNQAATNYFSGSSSGFITSQDVNGNFNLLRVLGAGSGSIALQGPTGGSGVLALPNGGSTITITIASGTATMTTGAIGAGACGATVTVAATGVLTTDAITKSYNAAPAANPAELVISAWPTANNVNFQYCNPSAGSVTPNAATLNWRVVR